AVRECIDVVRAMWRGERVTFDGSVVHVHDVALDCPLPPPIPVLIAARGPRMLALAGEIADIVHLASLFLGRENRAEELRRVAEGAERGGRATGSYEIDISVTVSASHDRERARRAALRNAAQSILWYAGADQYGRQREWSVPRGFAVPSATIEALAAGWDMWKDPDLPADLGALITDDVLDQFTVWGEPLECARRLRSLAEEAPGATGFRVKLPLPLRSRTLADYVGDVEALGEVMAAYRRAPEPAAVGAGRSMRTNRVKQLLKAGEPALGTFMALGSTLGAEQLAQLGFDWLVIDQEHGAIDATLTQSLLQAISTTETVPLIRVPWNRGDWIKRALDAGAYGVIV